MPYTDPEAKRAQKNRWVKTPAGRAYQARQRQHRRDRASGIGPSAPPQFNHLTQAIQQWRMQ